MSDRYSMGDIIQFTDGQQLAYAAYGLTGKHHFVGADADLHHSFTFPPSHIFHPSHPPISPHPSRLSHPFLSLAFSNCSSIDLHHEPLLSSTNETTWWSVWQRNPPEGAAGCMAAHGEDLVKGRRACASHTGLPSRHAIDPRVDLNNALFRQNA
ncbi:hypothetical protein C0Q70_16733 [Pomacea canaliculata]|uniref:Uncharacterized protein n=1 Tax=Pomacea canaliculata TaxID=400727 RepID=A0A2T7NQL8_POMCA|nr:hypothetical protein C0Q70_16733 [Pomacea canaliculata]